ncbi:sugar kinase [Propionibacteriaceae bacterium Y2011]
MGDEVVLCVGETMVLLTPDADFVDTARLPAHLAGAESNLARGLTHLGRPSRWVSRVGDDPFGALITATLTGYGVDTGHVVVDPDRPTGLMSKTVRGEQTRVRYYRSGSAASALSTADLTDAATANVVACHLSGVTPALSDSAADLVESVVVDRRLGEAMISFDVNHRPALWSAATAAPVLRRLADAADVVYVGLDEATSLWGCRTPAEVRAVLPTPETVVVKDADRPAVAFTGAERTEVPALRAEVVEVVGAGDAFAAGHLAAVLAGEDARTALRLGHLMAAFTVGSPRDLAPLPSADRLRALAAVDVQAWRDLKITPDLLEET